MALIVEDGTGLLDSNSYVTVAEVDAYFTDRGNPTWNGTGNKEHLLIQATDYLDAAFGSSFQGSKKTQSQALAFPRYNQGATRLSISQSKWLYPGISPFLNEAPVIPNELKKACFELAKLAVNGDLFPELTSAEDSLLTSKSVKVGPITVDKSSSKTLTRPAKNIYHKVEYILKPLLSNPNSVIR